MSFLGLSASAWVIVLQASMTYASIYSAWCFAIPVIRSQGLQFSRDTLDNVVTDRNDVRDLVKLASGMLAEKMQRDQPDHIRRNARGYVWLVISAVLFLAAVTLQVSTDSAFAGRARAETQAPT